MRSAKVKLHANQTNLRGRNIRENTLLVQEIIRRATGGALVFVDFAGAFDRVSHAFLWQVLDRVGVGPRMLHVVQSLYRNAHSKVCHGGLESRPFQLCSGVRQGDGLSPVLFAIVIDCFARMIDACQGIRGMPSGCDALGGVQRTRVGLHADDVTIALATDSASNSLQPPLAALQHVVGVYERGTGAAVNVDKTAIMLFGDNTQLGAHDATWRVLLASDVVPCLGIPVSADSRAVARAMEAWATDFRQKATPWLACGLSQLGRARLAQCRLAPMLCGID